MDTEKMNQMQEQTKCACKRHWKKGLAAVVILALIGGAGVAIDIQREHSAHAAKAAARSQLVAAQAARENVTLISEDEAKAKAAEAVGVDESALTFCHVNLENLAMQGKDKDRKEAFGKKDKEHGDRHDERDGRHGNENHDGDHGDGHDGASFRPDGHDGDHRMAPQGPMPGQPDAQMQGAPQGQPPRMPSQPPQGAPAAQAADGTNAPQPPQPPQMQPQSADGAQDEKIQPPQRQSFRFHPAYKVACEHSGVKYHVLIDAVSGNIMMCDVA